MERDARGGAELLTSNYVVVEASALAQHWLGLPALRAFSDDLLGVVRVEWVRPEDHYQGLSALFSAGRRKLSLVDCVSFEVMRRCGVQQALIAGLEQGYRLIAGAFWAVEGGPWTMQTIWDETANSP